MREYEVMEMCGFAPGDVVAWNEDGKWYGHKNAVYPRETDIFFE